MKRLAGRCRDFGVAFVGAVLVGGCASSAPIRFYTLTSMAPQTTADASAGAIPLRLARVAVPGELDRTQLVRRIDSTRLQIDDQDLWAAPLDEMVRRVLSADLAARLPANSVLDGNEPATGERLQTLAVDIHEFYADRSCAVTLQATWVLTPPQPGPGGKPGQAAQAAEPRQTTQEIQVPSAGACSGADPVPEAMSRALALLSDRIVAALGASPAAQH
jgi:uncharacterized lipoprotein YmbA